MKPLRTPITLLLLALVANASGADVTSVWGIRLSTAVLKESLTTTTARNVTIRNNVLHGLESRLSALSIEPDQLLENIRIENNTFQFPGLRK